MFESETKEYRELRNRWYNFAKKLRFIKDHGGYCKHCNKDLLKEPYDAEFHHLDEDDKKDNPSHVIKSCSYENAKKEIDKCILLCTACHRKVHFKWSEWEENKEFLMEIADTVHLNRSCQRTKVEVGENRENIKNLIEEGKSYAEISKELNIPKSTVAYNVDYMNLKSKNKSTQKITRENVEEYKKRGYTAREIAQTFNCDVSNVYRKGF